MLFAQQQPKQTKVQNPRKKEWCSPLFFDILDLVKKIFLLLAIIPLAFVLTGCDPVVDSDEQPPRNPSIVQVLTTDVAAEATIDMNDLRTRLIAAHDFLNDDRVEFELQRGTTTVQLMMLFSRSDWFWFEDLGTVARDITTDLQRNAFFFQQTITIPSPFTGQAQSQRTNNLVNWFYQEFSANTRVQNSVVLVSSFRRTRVDNSHRERHFDGWWYFFDVDEYGYLEDIVIFDRFANTPAWYGVGVGATAVFMLILWLVLRNRRQTPSQSNALQSLPFPE